jgi:uncharacterized membrane protein
VAALQRWRCAGAGAIRMMLLPVHIIAGALGIVSGAVALYAVKGATLHRKSGKIFVYAMLVMSCTAALMSVLQPNWGNVLQAVLTAYLVTTALLTVQRRASGFHWVDLGAMLVGLAVGLTHVTFGVEVSLSAAGTKDGYSPPMHFVFGSLALLAALGDLRMIRARGLHGFPRIARHLWRMCFALFIATGSFFLGQAKVIPQPLRIFPVLTVLALLPLVFMLYWLVRVRKRHRKRTAHLDVARVSATSV